jgi:4-carboxymuconolactone decarboxylase
MNRTEQLRFHVPNALKNGVTKNEIIEIITHLAFYAGWPNAINAVTLAKELLAPPTT